MPGWPKLPCILPSKIKGGKTCPNSFVRLRAGANRERWPATKGKGGMCLPIPSKKKTCSCLNAGLAVAEHFRDAEGQDVLLFIDNIFPIYPGTCHALPASSGACCSRPMSNEEGQPLLPVFYPSLALYSLLSLQCHSLLHKVARWLICSCLTGQLGGVCLAWANPFSCRLPADFGN